MSKPHGSRGARTLEIKNLGETCMSTYVLTNINSGESTILTRDSLSLADLFDKALVVLSRKDYSKFNDEYSYSRVLVHYLDTEKMTTHVHFNILAGYNPKYGTLKVKFTVQQGDFVPSYTYVFNIDDVEIYNLSSVSLVNRCIDTLKATIEAKKDKEKLNGRIEPSMDDGGAE